MRHLFRRDGSFAAWVLTGQLVLSTGSQAALNLLAGTVSNEDTAKVVEVTHRSPELSPDAAAYHRRGDDHIYILTDTAVYRAAQAGNPQAVKMLAGIIAHEHAHVVGGDESVAYTTQLHVLQTLGASSETIQEVQRARNTVVKAR